MFNIYNVPNYPVRGRRFRDRNIGCSIFTMFLTILYVVDGLETEALKYDFIEKWSDSYESVTVDVLWILLSGRTTTHPMV